MSTYRLDRLIALRSLAIVGASPRETSVGRHVVANSSQPAFLGRFTWSNRTTAKSKAIAPSNPSSAIAGTPDVVVIAVPPAAVPETVVAAGAKGAAAAMIIAAGHCPGSLAEAADQPQAPPACGWSVPIASGYWCRQHGSMRA
jgi:acetyltransferase